MKLLLLLMAIFLSLNVTAAHFKRVNGDIYVNTKKIPANQFSTVILKLNDVVEASGKSSFCQIVLDNGSTFLLRNGKLKLTKLEKMETVLGLFKGTLFASVKKSDEHKFRVKTKSASLGVRGTKFYVEVDSESTYLCVCEGRVEFRNKKQRKVLQRLEDVKAQIDEELKVTHANKDMLKMSKEGFGLMGIELNVNGASDW